MAANEIHEQDVGTEFRLTIKDGDGVVDLTSCTSKYIKFEKPDGTDIIKAASFYTDGSDGIIKYIGESGLLDMPGTWKIQAILGFSSSQFNSDVATFRVYKNI